MMFTSRTLLAIPLASLLVTTAAIPSPYQWGSWGNTKSSSPTQPSSSLPAPSSDVKLIALGLGTQNYTCASPSSPPSAVGALAKLYDATFLITAAQRNPFASHYASHMTCLADHTDNSLGLRQVGVHYFNGAGQPNFDLSGAGLYLQAAKLAVAPAPSDACEGRDGNAAVAWLYLGQNGGPTHGLSSVYRVETAGGNAISCKGTTPGQVVTSDYAAEYWFYA